MELHQGSLRAEGDGRDHGARGRPGLALSGFGQEEDVARSREAGFAAHLTKPLDGARLRRALDEIVPNLPRPDDAAN